ncbi:hypothetical protein [Actinokineospora sp.]|uniref:hypothetical protein n=1 Tax=Actinokineospora sp. TaxID=1872133 RepID=UPI004037872E
MTLHRRADSRNGSAQIELEQRGSPLSGHLDQAAGALNAAGQALPVEMVAGASAQIDGAVASIQQAGGAMGDELAGVALSIKAELDAAAGRLQALRQQLDNAAQAVVQRGF